MTFLEFFLIVLFNILHIILMVIDLKNYILKIKDAIINNKKILRKYFTISIYVFIIFSSMLPNRDNTSNINELNSIIPGINKLYNKDYDKESKNPRYLFEILQNII